MARIKSKKLLKLIVPIPVYDLTSYKFSNFTIENGIVVHNSKDLADSQAGSVYSAYQDYLKYPALKTIAEKSKYHIIGEG